MKTTVQLPDSLLNEARKLAREEHTTMKALTKVCGSQVHDARFAALCRDHGVTELWTADRDFGRFPDLKVRNPLVG